MSRRNLGRLENTIYSNKIEIVIFIFLFAICACGSYYLFFISDEITPKDQAPDPLFLYIGISIIATAIIMFFVYLTKLRAKIKIYELGIIIYSGFSTKVLMHTSIGHIDWTKNKSKKHGFCYYTNMIACIYDKQNRYMAQVDSNTFAKLEEKLNNWKRSTKKRKINHNPTF